MSRDEHRGERKVGTILRRVGLTALLIAPMSGLTACNSHPFPDSPPAFRGIVVPLPPPSFADAATIEIDFDGRVESNPAGTRVMLYEYAQDLGWFTYPDKDGNYLFESIPVELADNCLQLDVLEGGDEFLPTQLFTVVLRDGDACMDDPWCSEVDQEGACACVEQRYDITACSGG